MAQDRAPSHEPGDLSGHETPETSSLLPQGVTLPWKTQRRSCWCLPLAPWLSLSYCSLQRTPQRLLPPPPSEPCSAAGFAAWGDPSTALQTAVSPGESRGRAAVSGAEVTPFPAMLGAGGQCRRAKALRCQVFPSRAANWPLVSRAPVSVRGRTWTHSPGGTGADAAPW